MFGKILIPVILFLLGYGSVQLFSGLFEVKNDYKRCLQDLASSRFGNKWVAAFELSKIFPKIDQKDYPDLFQEIASLKELDERSEVFLTLTVAQLRLEEARSYLKKRLNSTHPEIRMYALLGLSYLDFQDEDYSSYFNIHDTHYLQALTYYVLQGSVEKYRSIAEKFYQEKEKRNLACLFFFKLGEDLCLKEIELYPLEMQKNFMKAMSKTLYSLVEREKLDLAVLEVLRSLEKEHQSKHTN